MPIRIKEQSPWQSQILVTKALFKRELITRFGKYKLGVVWMLLDPLVRVIFLGLVLGPFLGRSTGVIPYVIFLLCGFIQLRLCTNTIRSSLAAISANNGLLVFKKVQAIDPFIARFIFQLFSYTFALVTFFLIAYWFGVLISLDHLLGVVACVMITWVIGCGLGLHLGILTHKFNELEKILTYMLRPLLWISCVLHPLSSVPPQYTKYLLYNPMVHTIEYMRMALFPGYLAEGVTLYYPAAVALCSIAYGMMTYRNNRHFLTQR